MRIVHEVRGRIRFRSRSRFDSRLYGDFVVALPDAVKGVSAVRASPAARSLVVHYDGSEATRTALLERIARTPADIRPRRPEPKPTARYLRGTIVSAAVLTTGWFLPAPARLAVTWLVAAPTIVKGIGALLSSGLSVAALDAAALSIALARGEFGTAAATLTFLNLGNYLEATTSQASTDLLRRLLARPPAHAWVEAADGSVREVAAAEVREHDIVVVGPGEMIPVDGQILSGAATINLASITGESVPIDREAGAMVLAGGAVEEGRLRIRSLRVGSATTTARIAAFINSALDRKPVIQSKAERLAGQRVLLTLGVGALTFLVTRDLNRVASVFLIDYSCALKLGAPVAIKSALYRGGRDGILIKGGRSIEALSQVDTFVFDKTGTLSFGDLAVTDVLPIDHQRSRDRLLALLASLEEHARHPVADAIVREARRKALAHIHHDEVDFIVAHGLISEADGKRIVVGSRHFLEEHMQVPFAPFATDSERLEGEGKLLLYAAIDGEPAGIVALRDRPRPEAAAAMARLRELGVGTLVLLSGDREGKSRLVADALGLDMVYSERKPEEKAEVVRELQAMGRKVAFVGDGVNDAPALTAADVGIAMPRGAEISRATADVVLLRDSLSGVVEGRALAGETIWLIQSNFRWAVVLNTLLFIAAASGYASPVFSAVAHNSVTIATLLRALIGPRRSPPATPAPRLAAQLPSPPNP
ncbi:MAG: heavy metal translocating P-type ATPase [Rhodospirillales bacterium]